MRHSGSLCAALCLPLTTATAGVPVYTVDVDADLQRLNVTACFGDMPPAVLHAKDDRAGGYLANRRGTGPADVRMPIDPDASGCVRYGLRLSDELGGSFRAPVLRRPDAVVISPRALLWYPPDGGDIELRFRLPKGTGISTPWGLPDGDPDAPVFRTGARPVEWDARIAIGKLTRKAIDLPGGTLDVALLPGEPAPNTDTVLRWLRRGGEALVSAYGRLPLARVQVLVVPLGSGGEPVPWGEVQRGGGDAVHLYIDQRRGEREFRDDWVLVHELSHLLHPPMYGNSRWLYEGLASYYQNVLRARTGLLTEEAAWRKLHAGFRRGMAQTEPGRTLAEASRRMPWTREYMRVYWGGAAIALLADLELRQRSGGAQSLDTALDALRRCCLPAARKWTDVEVIEKLDALSGREVFGGLAERWLRSDRFPDLGHAYRALGLTDKGNEAITLAGGPAEQALRRAIMGGADATDPEVEVSRMTKADAVTRLEAAYGAPSQAGFGSAVFFDAGKGADDLTGAALAKYKHFVGDLWGRYGERAWLGPWKQVYVREPGVKPDIVAELRSIADPDARRSVPMLLEGVDDAETARAALSAVFDRPSVVEVRVFNLGDGAAMSGLLIAGRLADSGGIVFVVLLLD